MCKTAVPDDKEMKSVVLPSSGHTEDFSTANFLLYQYKKLSFDVLISLALPSMEMNQPYSKVHISINITEHSPGIQFLKQNTSEMCYCMGFRNEPIMVIWS